MNNPEETGIIYLRDLPKDIYIDLKDKFKLDVLNKARNITGTWVNLGEALRLKISKGRKCRPLECIREHKRFKLEVLLKIIGFLNKEKIIINEKDICKNITILSSHHNKGPNKLTNAIYLPKIPINFNNKHGGILIAALLGDGGIDKELKPHYNNNELILKKKVFESFCSVFGSISGNARSYKKQQIYFPKVAGTILTRCFRMKYGRKTKINPEIPKFIINSNPEIKSAFLQQVYDDEGNIYFNKESSQREIMIKFANKLSQKKCYHENIKKTNNWYYAPNLIKDIKKMIEDFDIKTSKLECVEIYQTKKGDYNTKWTIHIRSKPNLNLFINKINFGLKRKRNKLLKAYNSFHDFKKAKTKRISKIVEKCKEIENSYSYITSRLLAKKCNKSQAWAKQIIRELRKNNILKVKTTRWGIKGAKYNMVRKNS